MEEDQTRGYKSRAVSFCLDNDREVELYQFSRKMNFSEFVKNALSVAYRRGKSELTVDVTKLGDDKK